MIEDKIYEILMEIIPFDGVEIIYTKHYCLNGATEGYDEKNHLLMIRDANYCMCGYERDFELDAQVIIEALEKQLPIKVDYDNIITIQDGKTYKFYIEILKGE